MNTTRSEVVDNVLRFDQLSKGDASQREFRRSVIKNGKKFVALLDDEKIKFLPGHYAVASISQIDNLEQKQTVSAGQVERSLNEICGSAIEPANPIYTCIDEAYVSYCGESRATPSAHHQVRIYWLLRS
jgi:hypothetical protein